MNSPQPGRVVAFGEIMGRLAAPGFLRLRQALPGSLDVTFAGAEANVAVSIACLGGRAAFVTALPKGPVADACIAMLRGLGVDVSGIVRTDHGRLGLYYLEAGANQRPSNVIYDRDHSAVSLTQADAYDWAAALADADWFHLTGITPSLSRIAADAALHALTEARARGVRVSCDLNFRRKLWRWDAGVEPRDLAERTMRGLLEYVDLVIANEEDAADVLSIRAGVTDVESGRLDIGRYPDVARQIVAQFPNVRYVGVTLRQSLSASHNNWGGMLYVAETDSAHFAPRRGDDYAPYEIRAIVDRVGGGDAFAAGILFALMHPELADPGFAVAFAAASSCLAHSIVGDLNYASRPEVEALMQGSASGRVVR